MLSYLRNTPLQIQMGHTAIAFTLFPHFIVVSSTQIKMDFFFDNVD